jgi:2-amino-4-hydroxy-6-hydroxymethyldihydropteridine diphosphokinase
MSPSPRRALLGLGSNMGERRQFLRDAVAAIPDLVRVSSVFETEPVGGPEQEPYFNVVAEMATTLGARELLELCQSLEAAADRVRVVRWGPRTLDVDVLWLDGVTVDEPDLIVPHPRMFDRAFVMVPLAELAPDIAQERSDPGTGEVINIGEL